jgi:hypothetical protein
MHANIAQIPLTMPYLEEELEDEVSSILDQWPLLPSMPPAGNDMHLLTEQFSGAHPGEEWEYNKISAPKYFWFLIPDLSILHCQIIAP